MHLLLLGSGDFGLPTFEALRAQHQIAGVVTQPDRPAGRKRIDTPTPVAAWAAEHELTVHKTDNVNSDQFVRMVRQLGADASVVIAFGQKLSPQLIDSLGNLAVNLHASLLPRYRGAAPINWAMIRGEKNTGVSVIGLAQKMDAGEVYATASLAIDPHETAGELHDRLALLGPAAVQRVLDDLQRGTLQPQVQDHNLATPAPKLKKSDGTVDFNQPAEAVRCRIHGLTPWPGCRVQWGDQVLALHRAQDEPNVTHGFEPGTIMGGLRVACASGCVRLLEVQPPGKALMSAAAFARGHAIQSGQRLSSIAEP
ncbi:MAG: methionyl-tRNA formyltransferase [Phycisphaeraceae bacterium]|nr:methionyl-tRNA formyltransferase [Phycisphaeraceae bacterium]